MFKKLLKKIILREKADSKSYVSYLRKLGVRIGEDVSIYSPTHTEIDVTCPWLLSIGDHVRISRGVVILTHDFSWSVLKLLPENPGCVLGAQSPVSIGNNVFLGMNAIVTRGVTIGDNVVIGAGSVVTKDCESNWVYAGVPAQKIMPIEDFYNKRKELQIHEAMAMANCYYNRFGKKPTKEEFHEYFMLFCDVDQAKKVPRFKAQMEVCGNFEDSCKYMQEHAPVFDGFESFMQACFRNDES